MPEYTFHSFVYQNKCLHLNSVSANIKLLRIINSKYMIGSNSSYVWFHILKMKTGNPSFIYESISIIQVTLYDIYNLKSGGDEYLASENRLSELMVVQFSCNAKSETRVCRHVRCRFFLFDQYYITKRMECQASTIKYLRKTKQIDGDEKDVKIDLILFNSQLGDVFSCEDKPTSATESDVETDIKKARDLREKRLKYIQSILPYPSCIEHIEVISSQFYGLVLTIYGSKMTKYGVIIHCQKSTATIPSQAANMPQLAHFLLTVMTLQRVIIINLKKLIAIYEASLQDSIGFLASPFNSTNNNMFFREDSPEPTTNSSRNESNTLGENWVEIEQVNRVLMLIDKKIKEVGHDNCVLTRDDWESIISIDDA